MSRGKNGPSVYSLSIEKNIADDSGDNRQRKYQIKDSFEIIFFGDHIAGLGEETFLGQR